MALPSSLSHWPPSAWLPVKRKLPWVFLGFSLICFIAAGLLLYQRYYNPFRLDLASPPPASASKFSPLPVRIALPDVQIDLSVIPSRITDGHWLTTPAGVSYLTASVRPGETGNSVFYGHNWPRLLGNLRKAQVGQLIIVTNSDDTQVQFRIVSRREVSPDDTSILFSGNQPVLTLYTCSGFLDTKRLVLTAMLSITQ